jgi:hypothetical protein
MGGGRWVAVHLRQYMAEVGNYQDQCPGTKGCFEVRRAKDGCLIKEEPPRIEAGRIERHCLSFIG